MVRTNCTLSKTFCPDVVSDLSLREFLNSKARKEMSTLAEQEIGECTSGLTIAD
jgi:hypothetical protein